MNPEAGTRTRRGLPFLGALLALVSLAATVVASQGPPGAPVLLVNPNTGETPEAFAARTKWWRDAKFGMFIHWGVYSVPADATDRQGRKSIAEWYFSNKQLQVGEYERYAGQFNPARFDARLWVKTAKDAGMKYIVITSKHHDGFCMFDSKLTGYSIARATPFRRDPLRELADECRRQGLVLCFYYSIMDWHHPDYLPRRPWEGTNRPAAGADLGRYVAYMKGQLTELLRNYGRVGVIWFDGGWEHNDAQLASKEVNRLIRSLQPGILINDRNHLPEDHSTPEQTIPANALPGGRLWETCMTVNDTWGYARNDANWKSTEDLVRKLCDIASKGGNFLLNVGPTELGEFPPAIRERLGQIGAWMRSNGASIYESTKSPYRRLPFEGRCTTKGNRLYLQVFRWPSEGLSLAGLKTPLEGARCLATGERLNAYRDLPQGDSPGLVHVSRPARLDPYATVIELTLAGTPAVEEASAVARPGADGSFTLKAVDAEIHGQTAQYEQGGGKDNIGFWTNAQDFVTWACAVPRAGRYRVEVDYACPPGNAGSRFTVGPDGEQRVVGVVKATGSWTAFRTEPLAELFLPAGRQTVAVRATEMPRGAVMNLRTVRLVPQP